MKPDDALNLLSAAELTSAANKREIYLKLSNGQNKLVFTQVKTPLAKRLFDISVSASALLMLSPLFLLVAILIKLDSKGPVFYKSKRVGTGYKIFDLIKFRTMKTGADSLIKNMASHNLYSKATEEVNVYDMCASCKLQNTSCQSVLYTAEGEVCETLHLQSKKAQVAFMKFQNDPRITPLGKFLRNSSIDELPQLINILKGDMSLVGNRPLPLYEAEKLTTDAYIMRFAAPAGLTGLWQVTKRGKGKQDMSEEERMQLDIEYAKKFSFWFDIKIILKTFPALLQSENV